MNKSLVIGIIIIVILIGGGIFFLNKTANAPEDGTNVGTQPPTGALPTTDQIPPTNPSGTPNGQSGSDTGVNVGAGADVSIGAKVVTVTFNGDAFEPKAVTINKGDTVKFVNNSSGKTWPASAVHPTHAVYDGTTLQQHCAPGATPSFDACGGIPAGGSWSFTFAKTGTFGYHDHLNASITGSVTVK